MTEQELAAVVKVLAPVIREAIAAGVTDVKARLQSLEERNPYKGATKEFWDGLTETVVDLRGRLTAVEGKALLPGPPGDRGLEGHVGKDGAPGRDGEPGPTGDKGADGAIGDRGPDGPEGLPGRDGRDGLPGVPGLPGEKGADGLHGKDGTDGLGFDDFEELFDGERTFTHRFKKGEHVREFVHKTAIEIYRGVWVEGKAYERGDRTTWAGSEWHCNEDTTSKPGDGSKAWTLTVKKGRDGRDGKDGERGPQGPTGKDWQQMVTR